MWQIDLTVCHKLERSGADDGMEPLTHEEVQIMLDGRFSLELLFDGAVHARHYGGAADPVTESSVLMCRRKRSARR